MNSSNTTLGNHVAEDNGYSIVSDYKVTRKQIIFLVTNILEVLFSYLLAPWIAAYYLYRADLDEQRYLWLNRICQPGLVISFDRITLC